MAENPNEMKQIRVTEEQREALRMLKTSGETYSDALDTVLDSDPEEYRAIVEIAEQKAQKA